MDTSISFLKEMKHKEDKSRNDSQKFFETEIKNVEDKLRKVKENH